MSNRGMDATLPLSAGRRERVSPRLPKPPAPNQTGQAKQPVVPEGDLFLKILYFPDD